MTDRPGSATARSGRTTLSERVTARALDYSEAEDARGSATAREDRAAGGRKAPNTGVSTERGRRAMSFAGESAFTARGRAGGAAAATARSRLPSAVEEED